MNPGSLRGVRGVESSHAGTDKASSFSRILSPEHSRLSLLAQETGCRIGTTWALAPPLNLDQFSGGRSGLFQFLILAEDGDAIGFLRVVLPAHLLHISDELFGFLFIE